MQKNQTRVDVTRLVLHKVCECECVPIIIGMCDEA